MKTMRNLGRLVLLAAVSPIVSPLGVLGQATPPRPPTNVRIVSGSGSATGCPLPAYPSASCTGVPAGTTLTVATGNKTYSTAGQVISGLDIHGKVIINANNVTLKNSIVRGPA